MIGYGQALGLDLELMKSILDEDAFGGDVRQDKDDARAVGINATPSFVLGRRERDRVRGERLVGVLPLSFFEARIRDWLKQAEQPRPRFGIETGMCPQERSVSGVSAPPPGLGGVSRRSNGRFFAWKKVWGGGYSGQTHPGQAPPYQRQAAP